MKSFSPVAGESANRISAMLLKWIMTWRLVNFISLSSMIQCLQLGDLLEEDIWKSAIILHAWFKPIQREKRISESKVICTYHLSKQWGNETCCMEDIFFFTCSFWSGISLSLLYLWPVFFDFAILVSFLSYPILFLHRLDPSHWFVFFLCVI